MQKTAKYAKLLNSVNHLIDNSFGFGLVGCKTAKHTRKDAGKNLPSIYPWISKTHTAYEIKEIMAAIAWMADFNWTDCWDCFRSYFLRK